MTARLAPDEQIAHLRRGCVEIISEPELTAKFAKSTPLVIKAGFDPTAPDLHLGHTVLLRKLRQFQDLGHKVVFLIGDATALVGDPSGQSKMRKLMTIEDVERNAKTYEAQVSKILDTNNRDRFQREHNSRWFLRDDKTGQEWFTFGKLVEMASRYSLARIWERDDFQKRLKAGQEVSMLEAFYPMMQGYDSVMLGKHHGSCDVELGGTDQKFNMLVGRDLQRRYGQEPQVVMTTPLLVGLDGVHKMSKSLGNHIGINEPPEEMFGKLMSISDDLMWSYFELLTNEDVAAVKRLHPMDAKKRLACLVVEQYHDATKAKAAQDYFESTVQRKENPNIVEVIQSEISGDDPRLFAVVSIIFDVSRGEARRKSEQGGIKVDGQVIKTPDFPLELGQEYWIQYGKRVFHRVRLMRKDA